MGEKEENAFLPARKKERKRKRKNNPPPLPFITFCHFGKKEVFSTPKQVSHPLSTASHTSLVIIIVISRREREREREKRGEREMFPV